MDSWWHYPNDDQKRITTTTVTSISRDHTILLRHTRKAAGVTKALSGVHHSVEFQVQVRKIKVGIRHDAVKRGLHDFNLRARRDPSCPETGNGFFSTLLHNQGVTRYTIP